MKHYYQKELEQAVEGFRAAMAATQREQPAAYAVRKGRTLYVVSDEARTLRRLDAVYSEAR